MSESVNERERVKERLLLSFVNNKPYPNSAPFNQQRRIAKRLTKKQIFVFLGSLSVCIFFSVFVYVSLMSSFSHMIFLSECFFI